MKSIFNVSCKALVALVTCAALLISGSAFAQNTIKGKVVEANGEPVIGASVILPGTTQGVVTGVDGTFELNVAAGKTLEVSCIGFTTQQVAAANGMVVTLAEDTTFLDEVVVVGYGVQKKSDVTGAVARVGADELTTKPVNNAFEALQGKVAGVDITSSERPGTLGSVRIRGQRSISAGSDPLYVVDGVPLQAGGIEAINPHDIEAVDVLKDASATAIYGSRGANGVIIITTKRGQAGKFHLNYSGAVTMENLVDKSPVFGAADYVEWVRWAKYNADPTINPRGDQPSQASDQAYFTGIPTAAYNNIMKGWAGGKWDPSKVEDYDWGKLVTQTGITQEHTLSASGGNDKIQGFVSGGYLKNDGTQKGQSYERFNFAGSMDILAKPWMKLGASFNTSYSVQKYGYSRTGQSSSSGPVDIYNAAKAIPRFALPYNEAGEIEAYPAGTAQNVYTVMDEWTKSNDNRETFRAFGSFYAQINFGEIWEPLKGLSWKTNFGPDFRLFRNGIFIQDDSAVKMGSKNYAKMSMDRYFSWTLDNMLTYNRTFGVHGVGLTLLQSASKYNKESMSESANAIPDNNYLWYYMSSISITDTAYGAGMSTGLSENQLESYMARLNYSLMDRYLLTVSGRWDGASVLAAGHKWDFFPSAAFAWKISEEPWFNAASIDLLKLRLGAGTTGNAAVGAYSTLGNIQGFRVPFNTGEVQAYATNEPYYTGSLIGLANKSLGWEKTTQYNLGLDFSFLGGRINGSIDAYKSYTNDLILSMSIPTLTGYSSTTANIGKTTNHGLELSLNAYPIQTRDFTWETNFNAALQKEAIVELATGKEDDLGHNWFIGQPVNVFYTFDNEGLWQDTAEDKALMEKFNANGHNFTPGSIRPKDQNGDFTINDDDKVILGQKTPSFTMGWMNTFSWKGLSLAVELFGRMGYMISTGGEAQLNQGNQRAINYWTPDNPNAEWQKPVYSTAGGDSYTSLLGFKKASFIKVRNISLAYSFPRSACEFIGIESLKVFAQAKNLGNLYSTVDFIDLDLGTTFYNRGVTFGVQIGF